MKKIWHDIKEMPVIPNGEVQVRIALFERRPVEHNTDLTFTIINSERIYREQDYTEKKWKLFVMEHHLEKWCYWNELVSDNVILDNEQEQTVAFLVELEKEVCQKYEGTCDECPFGHWEYQEYNCVFKMFKRNLESFVKDEKEINRIEANQ